MQDILYELLSITNMSYYLWELVKLINIYMLWLLTADYKS
jgi:hypothetical protein